MVVFASIIYVWEHKNGILIYKTNFTNTNDVIQDGCHTFA